MNLEIILLDEQAKPLTKMLSELKDLGYKHLVIATDTGTVTAVREIMEYGMALLYSYEEARRVICDLRILTPIAYKRRCRLDPKLSPRPELHYAKKWTGWDDFLQPEYYSYQEFCMKIKELGVRNWEGYRPHCKEDLKLPLHPSKVYAGKWKGFSVIRWM